MINLDIFWLFDMSKKVSLDWIDDNEKRIIDISDKIWENPELGLFEYKTAKLLSDEIERHGFKVDRGVAGMPTAFLATWGSGKPVIGIMGELDALPGLSQKTLPHRDPIEEGAPGHGCGHNIYGTSGMAGAIALKMAMEKANIPGTIKFYGCPAEESHGGKVFMVRDGLFDDVDACLSHHPWPSNSAGLCSGNAMNSVKFEFYGAASHAAMSPHLGISALDAVELMNMGVNYLREHMIEKARIHYVIESGGRQPNVVPDYARSWYYIRSPEREQVDQLYEKVLKIAEGAALMTGTTHKVKFLSGSYNLLPNKTLSELVTANMREIGAPKHTNEELDFAKELSKSFDPEQKKESMIRTQLPDWEKMVDEYFDERILDAWDEGTVNAGSSDVSDVSWNTPTIEFGTTSIVIGTLFHSWQFTAQTGMSIGHKSLIFASKVIATSAMDLMTKPDLLKKTREDWRKQLAGRVYKSPLPADLKPPLNQ